MLSEKRILRLAEKYGPFVRFDTEGSEGKDDVLDDVIKEGEKDQLKDNPEFEKTRQRADQEAANAIKARKQLSQAHDTIETARLENESLKKQLEQAEAKASQVGIKEIDLDESQYDGTDLPLVKAIKTLNKKIDAKDKEIEGLKNKALTYEERDRQEQIKLARNSAYDELLGDLDEEYGADCRNDALKKFNELCERGDVPKGNPAKATRIMERCYKEVKTAKSKDPKKKEKSSLSLDTGSGGGGAPTLSGFKIKSGQSLDEAVAQLTAAAKKS